ncbi:AAA family ATPase [Dethiobacter alkaliphilus]|uniref:Vesicle-fusing ATPase n=1 Tax=Dethiobacter alkaliphilus AHT 1 TaxID=555088 RepID=C0GKF8_DETAL|nr:AAA family ATPase [Dethiobacter alkaliphilus]EEG76201.1 Vesicle-fusing ATPase [Dethiobacter alkaliphilus AHT 1]
MIREAGIGASVAILAVLAWQGVNVAPVIFFGAIFAALYYFAGTKGGNKNFAVVENKKDHPGNVKFEQIGGQRTAKKELLEALDFVRHPEKVAQMGIRPLKGILLVGPPGTGKTLLAKAAAAYTDSVFMAASGSEFIEMYAGVGAQRIRQIFSKARSTALKEKKKSAIIFIDEIEILGGKRGSHSSHHEYDQTLNQLLVEMDGMATDDRVRTLLIGATNRADMLDGALVRPGRFDRTVQVDLPDMEARTEILKLHAGNKPLEDVDLETIAKETFGFSGAHLESVANEAAILAMREQLEKITHQHFAEAIDKVIMGEKLERRPDKEELWRVGVHEIGHALISEIKQSGSVSTITTTPRGKALGYMRQSPQKDSYLHTQEYLEGQIAIMVGGAVAEELVLGNRSTGAANDFQQAVNAAKQIIASGMSTLGVVSLDDLPGNILHKVIQQIIARQEESVKALLGERKELITELAELLVTEEKVSGEHLRARLSEQQVQNENIA